MRISIIGTGYVGLVSGACLSELGHDVVCLDVDRNKIENLKSGKISFYEPYLAELVTNNAKKKKLIFTTSFKSSANSDVIFLCVDTPRNKDGKANLENLWSAIKSLSKFLKSNSIIVLKSTVPLGTCAEIVKFFRNLDNKSIPKVCSNPEFLKEGSAVNDFLRPDRIIIGSKDLVVKEILSKLYEPLNRKSNKLIYMSPESAELVKYSSNAFLATKISFMNQISRLCEEVGADVDDVRKGMGSDKRIGKDFLYAGIGYGGSCFPKDLSVLEHELRKINISNNILRSTMQTNDEQLIFFRNKILKYFLNRKVSIDSINLTVWGATFKPNTSDIRESQSIKLINDLAKRVNKIFIYDPVVRKEDLNKALLSNNIYVLDNMYSKINMSEGLIICTEWKEFWNPNLHLLEDLKSKIIFDGRNILNREMLSKFNIDYIGIGR